MMILACDFGGSTTKIIHLDNFNPIFKDIIPTEDPQAFLEREVDDRFSLVICTGGKSMLLPDEVNSVKLFKVPEFNAIAQLGRDYGTLPQLVVSIGTGTPFLLVSKSDYQHLGGTGLGGGPLFGLANRLLGVETFKELENLAVKGDPTNVNLTVGDIVGDGIGTLPPDATASNFAKRGGSDEDIAAGLYLLIGEPIGSMVAMTLRSLGLNKVLFAGSVMTSKILPSLLESVLTMFGFEMQVVEEPMHAILNGAISYYQSTV